MDASFWAKRGFASSTVALHIGSPCVYCDAPIDIPTRDHIYPRSLGGGNQKKNIVVVCRQCNMDKGSIPLFSWHRLLIERGDPRVVPVERFMRSIGYKMKARPCPTLSAT